MEAENGIVIREKQKPRNQQNKGLNWEQKHVFRVGFGSGIYCPSFKPKVTQA